MSKRYLNAAIVYACLALAGGVFFREYTKAIGFTGETALSVVHAHYFALGMIVFILLALLEKAFGFSDGKNIPVWLVVYHTGLNITVAGLVLRGLAQASNAVLSRGLDASLSGISGLGLTLLGVSLLFILFSVRKKAG